MELFYIYKLEVTVIICFLKVMLKSLQWCCQFLRAVWKVTGWSSSVTSGKHPLVVVMSYSGERNLGSSTLQPWRSPGCEEGNITPLFWLQGRWWLGLNYQNQLLVLCSGTWKEGPTDLLESSWGRLLRGSEICAGSWRLTRICT